jgi:hypothetical protein
MLLCRSGITALEPASSPPVLDLCCCAGWSRNFQIRAWVCDGCRVAQVEGVQPLWHLSKHFMQPASCSAKRQGKGVGGASRSLWKHCCKLLVANAYTTVVCVHAAYPGLPLMVAPVQTAAW